MCPFEEAQEIIQAAGGRKVLREDEAKRVLRCYGIQIPDFHLIKGPEDLERLKLRFPVALKVCSENILHKTEKGGVKLNIGSMEELRKELKDMGSKLPSERFLVEPMERGGFELIAGLFKDQTFGLAIMTGVGGILTELYKDVSFRTVPIEEYDAREMLSDLRAKKLFEGFRGIKADINYIIDLLLKLSRLGNDLRERIDQMDLNPIMVREKDAVVVDAKLILV